jgi:hypothetical protein
MQLKLQGRRVIHLTSSSAPSKPTKLLARPSVHVFSKIKLTAVTNGNISNTTEFENIQT